MKSRALLFLAGVTVLGGCSPEMDARMTLAGRRVTLTNTDNRAYRIERILVNGKDDNGDCIQTPATTLGPGESYSTIFPLCGSIATLSVKTNKGTWALER